MKILLLLTTLLFSSISIAEEMKLLTWNVFMIPKPINFSKQKERTRLISEELQKSDYDVILLQEAFVNRFRRNLGQDLRERYPYQEHLRKSRRLLHFINSGLFVLSKHPFEVLGWHYFNHCTHADCFSSKGVMLIEVTTPEGKKVQLAMTHMQAWNDESAKNVRKAQIEEIHDLLKTYARPGVPQILAGDLNIDGLKQDEFPAALNRLGMTSTELNGPLTATNGFKVECYKTPGGSKDGEWLDHIWMRQNDTDALILNKKVKPFISIMGKDECSLSDHYAIEAVLKL